MKASFKYKLITTAFIFFASFCVTHAQTFNLNWGEAAKMNNDFEDAVNIGGGKSIVLKKKFKSTLFGPKKYELWLLQVDANMETLSENQIDVEEKESDLTGFEKYGNNIFVTYKSYNKEDKTTSAYALKIDPKTLAITSKIILGVYESDNRGDQASIATRISNDSTKILTFVEGPERKKENKKFYFSVYNTDLKKLWSKEVELPILQKFVGIYDYDVSNDGVVYVSIKHYESEVNRETVREDGEKVPSYVYKLLVYSKDAKDAKEIVFNLDKKFIAGTKIIYNKNNTATVAGLYKTKYNGKITGVFYANLDNDSKIKNQKMLEFPSDMIALVDKDGYASKKRKRPRLITILSY